MQREFERKQQTLSEGTREVTSHFSLKEIDTSVSIPRIKLKRAAISVLYGTEPQRCRTITVGGRLEDPKDANKKLAPGPGQPQIPHTKRGLSDCALYDYLRESSPHAKNVSVQHICLYAIHSSREVVAHRCRNNVPPMAHPGVGATGMGRCLNSDLACGSCTGGLIPNGQT